MTSSQQIKSDKETHESSVQIGRSIDIESLKVVCEELGVELIGLTELVDEKGLLADWFQAHVERLKSWIERGDHAEMSWMQSQLEKRCDLVSYSRVSEARSRYGWATTSQTPQSERVSQQGKSRAMLGEETTIMSSVAY